MTSQEQRAESRIVRINGGLTLVQASVDQSSQAPLSLSCVNHRLRCNISRSQQMCFVFAVGLRTHLEPVPPPPNGEQLREARLGSGGFICYFFSLMPPQKSLCKASVHGNAYFSSCYQVVHQSVVWAQSSHFESTKNWRNTIVPI